MFMSSGYPVYIAQFSEIIYSVENHKYIKYSYIVLLKPRVWVSKVLLTIVENLHTSL